MRRLLPLILLSFFTLPAQAADLQNSCVDEKLVNHCRIWFGANSNLYSEVPKGMKSRIEYLEQRMGRKIDIAHTYHGIGDNELSEDNYYFINRPDTLLYTNWKPAARWSDAAGNNAATNATIDQMAQSIKKAAPHKIFLTVYHEPEDQVEGGTACESYSNKEKAGTPADYRAMWKNVRARFDALGVDNVVWVMNYMGFDRWNCMVNDLWPGNELVDWVTWDSYASPRLGWPDSPMRLYRFLEANSTPEHDYTSKPWGLGEFGVWGGDQKDVKKLYDAMYDAIDQDAMPRLKMYLIFDNRESRVAYTKDNKPAPEEQEWFNRFANHPRFTKPLTQ